MGYYNSFVVKIWADESEGTIRGQIQHVSTQESIHFLNMDKMVDFIMDHLSPPTGYSIPGEEGSEKFMTLSQDSGTTND